MNWVLVKTSKIKSNPDNPRVIKDDSFKKLVKSIQTFPKMLELRPIVVNSDYMVLGGNMRLKACKEVGLKEIPVVYAEFLTPEEQKEFIIKDNSSFGQWDFDQLANEWSVEELDEWGVEIPDWHSMEDVDLDNFFDEQEQIVTKEGKHIIVLEYPEDDYKLVLASLKSREGTKEQIIKNLLGL